MTLLAAQRDMVQRSMPMRVTGRVVGVTGLTVQVEGLPLPVGSMCVIHRRNGTPVDAQIVGVSDDRVILMTLQDPQGVGCRDAVVSTTAMQTVAVGRQMLGRVFNGLGQQIDDKPPFTVEAHYPVFADAPPALERPPINRPLGTGIRAIDALNVVGTGQRMGIFAGTGVGKSVLLGMIARFATADVIVVGLIGERGREVGDFIRDQLGEEGMRRSVVVVSTSDQSPVLRVRACFLATAVAEYFRDQGKDVLLLMDSTTRMAMAQRQIGLAAGEPPATKGYPPSVFAMLPRLLERAGRTKSGSITGLYTVLVEGDDISEPISDAVRGTLDGHLWLSRELANAGHYPAVSVLDSISRVMVNVADEEHLEAARSVRRVLGIWKDIEDLVNIGAYAKGTSVEFDVAVAMKPRIDAALRQNMNDCVEFGESRDAVIALHAEIEAMREELSTRSAEPEKVA